jgi:hypothetical protein
MDKLKLVVKSNMKFPFPFVTPHFLALPIISMCCPHCILKICPKCLAKIFKLCMDDCKKEQRWDF